MLGQKEKLTNTGKRNWRKQVLCPMIQIVFTNLYTSNVWREKRGTNTGNNKQKKARPRGYKIFFMFNSTEHEIFPAY